MKNILFALCIVSALVLTGCHQHHRHHRDDHHRKPQPVRYVDQYGRPVAKHGKLLPPPRPAKTVKVVKGKGKGKVPPPPAKKR